MPSYSNKYETYFSCSLASQSVMKLITLDNQVLFYEAAFNWRRCKYRNLKCIEILYLHIAEPFNG